MMGHLVGKNLVRNANERHRLVMRHHAGTVTVVMVVVMGWPMV
jgi:hypothetical protein